MAFSEDMFPFIRELDDDQRAAVTAEENTVVSAGAGSGKTKVLCARYGYLIMTGRCEVDQILTITFTNKAANEMYRRIYSLLSEYTSINEYARKAVESFHKAWISTLDSFCLGIARNVCRRFGISPDFKSNDVEVKKLARSLALRFVLDNRNNPALQLLIAEKKIKKTADELFVKPVLNNSTVSSPLDFNYFEKIQREALAKNWRANAGAADERITLIEEQYDNLPERLSLHEQLSAVLPRKITAPVIETLFEQKNAQSRERENLVAYLEFLESLTQCKLSAGKNESFLIIKEAIIELRKKHELLQAIANSVLQWDIVQAVFPLIAEYQEILNKKKRETGFLTFNDIAHLAVDGLRTHEDLRRMYQETFRMIMIDEFQDNNRLQLELIKLLSGSAKVFYVGDEKQSIYRFRGADVSVFRNLSLHTEKVLRLNQNYRSLPILINAFNLIFGGYNRQDDPEPQLAVFPPEGTKIEDYRAAYRWINSRNAAKTNSGGDAALHFAFFDEGRRNEENSKKAAEHEAFYIAAKIKELHNQKTAGYNDFAVLMRSHTHQHSLEKAFKLYAIPFIADRPASLFNDAPVNDLWTYLKLLVYPEDKIAYATLLRSPFVRLSEESFTLCMLHGGTIFDESIDSVLPPQDLFRYQEARRHYWELLSSVQDLPISSLITALWYNYGYRHEALWSASTQVYLDRYDLFFELARIIEERGGSLVDFLDYLEELANKEEKPDDSILPSEESGGVRIMTIHRSKGLEFPVVFLYSCGSAEKISFDQGLAHYSSRWGVVLKLPQMEEFPQAKDCFLLAEEQEHRDKTDAELRRLLYVAMTRAEQKLYVTAVIPKQNKEEREELCPEDNGGYGKQFIIERLEQYKRKENVQSMSFLGLLPGLSDNNPLYTIEAIDCYEYNAQTDNTAFFSLEESTLQVTQDYETIPAAVHHQYIPQTINASSLCTQTENYISEPDELLQQCGIEAHEFGTIVHGFIEDTFNGITPKLPFRFAADRSEKEQKTITLAAQTLTEKFFNSPLGRKAVSASFRKIEHPIITAVKGTRRRILVSGKIDLLFDDGDSIYVVDFKTDRDENKDRHVGQLAIYRRAVEDIFGKPVKCRLFYLRSGSEADLTDEINKTSPEELIAMWESSST